MRRRDSEDVTEMSGWLYADLLLGLAVVFLVAVPFVGISDSSSTECPTVVVPDVLDKTIDEAAKDVESRGLVVKRVPLEQQGVAEDEVYLQEPQAGARVCEGFQVRLTYNLRQDPAPEVYPETFKAVVSLKDAAGLGRQLNDWIVENEIRKLDNDAYVNVALVYGFFNSNREKGSAGVGRAKDFYRRAVEGCKADQIAACLALEALSGDATVTKEARFIGTEGKPPNSGDLLVRDGQVFVEMFVVCPDKCKD